MNKKFICTVMATVMCFGMMSNVASARMERDLDAEEFRMERRMERDLYVYTR